MKHIFPFFATVIMFTITGCQAHPADNTGVSGGSSRVTFSPSAQFFNPTGTVEPRTATLDATYTSPIYYFTISYDKSWSVAQSSPAAGVQFTDSDGNVFDVGINDLGYDVPTLAYSAILQRHTVSPFTSRNVGGLCAIRDDNSVYIQRVR